LLNNLPSFYLLTFNLRDGLKTKSFNMSLICPCPQNAAVGDIDQDLCLERVGEVQRFGLQRTLNGTTENEIVIGTSNPNLLATWTDLKSATDSTRVQFSPEIHAPSGEPGEMREYGGEGETLGGVVRNLGRRPTPFQAEFLDITQKIAAQLKAYECEKKLSVFLIAESGLIWGLTDDLETPTVFKGIPIEAFFTSDKHLGHFVAPDKNYVRWSFKPNWSDMLYAITPSDFSALTEL
jgi:hypothetical protein